MPVTARLLQRLHQTLGDDATNDLFAWWEEATTMNRTAVREIADLYFDRFDARLEKRLAEELASLRAELVTRMADQRASLIKWMFMFWIGTLVPLGGLIVAILTRQV